MTCQRCIILKRPLVHALAFFALGILGGFFIAQTWALAAFFALCAVISLCMFVMYRWAGAAFMPVLALAGFIAITLSVSPSDPNIEELARRNREAVFAGRVVQLTSTRNGSQRATIELESVRFGDYAFTSRVRLTAIISERSFARYDLYASDYAYGLPANVHINPEVQNGQHIIFTGIPRQLSRARNPGAFDEFIFYRSRGISYSINPQILHTGDVRVTPLIALDNFRGRIADIYDAALPEREAGIARSIILGDRSSLERDVTELFRRAGIAHILTISGLHISIVALTLERLFGLALRRKNASALTLALVGLYVAFTGFGLPAVRAFIMYFVLTLGRLINRDRDLLTSISLAAFLLLIARPTQLFDVGFQFSFAAVYAIAIGGPSCEKLIWRFSRKLPPLPRRVLLYDAVRSSVMTTIVITLFTLPLVVNTFSYFYPYSVITNTVIVPTLFAATSAGFVVGIAGLVSPDAAMFVSGIFFAIMQIYVAASYLSVSLPGAEILVGHIPYILWALWWLLLILVFAWINGGACVPRRAVGGFALVTLMVFAAWFAVPRGLSVTFVDVGQGDGIVIRNGRRTYVVDGGGNFLHPLGENTGVRTMIPYLQHLGVRQVDGVFFTHFDFDHVTGLLELVDAGLAREVFISDTQHDPDDAPLYRILIEITSRNGTPVTRIAQGFVMQDGGLTIECIHPQLGSAVYDESDNSLVLSLSYGEVSFLLTGDITRDAELDILSRGHDISTSVLKLGHHGSATSSSSHFLEASNPEIAIVSAGRNNRFNHPSYSTLIRLQEAGLPHFNTAHHGAIIIHARQDRMTIRTML